MNALSIQSTFVDVVTDVENGTVLEEKFWINFIPGNELEDGNAMEELVNVVKKDDEVKFENGNGLVFVKNNEHHYSVSYKGFDYNLTVPNKVVSISEEELNATSFDVSINEGLFILGTDDGKLQIGDLKDGNIINKIEDAHHSSVLHTLFFSSGKVALTAGLDYQIKIWDVLDGSNPRSFLGHQQRITDLAMIGRGRNFLSASKDGTIKLWDCASGLNISTLTRNNSVQDGINGILISEEGTSPKVETGNSYEVGTAGKTVYAGHESGVVTQFDLSSKLQISTLESLHSEVQTLTNYKENYIIVGYQNGDLALWDKRNNESSVSMLNLAPGIDSVQVNSEELLVKFKAGFLSRFSDFPNSDKFAFKESLVGFENDRSLILASQRPLKSNYVLSHEAIYKYTRIQ